MNGVTFTKTGVEGKMVYMRVYVEKLKTWWTEYVSTSIGICRRCFFSFLVLCISYAIMSTGQKIVLARFVAYYGIGP